MERKGKIDVGGMLFSLYLVAVYAAYLLVNGDGELMNLLFAVAALPLAQVLLRAARRVELPCRERCMSRRGEGALALAFFAADMAILLVWYAAYAPGAFSPDSMNQLEQAVSGSYSDWHPFLHTLLFFTLPLRLTGSAAAIVPFQMILFAGILAYACVCAARYFGVKAGVAANAYIMLNPYTCDVLMFPWKDVAFGMMALLAAVYVLNIHCSAGAWLQRRGRVLLLAAALALATLFRHNAALFTLTMLAALFFAIPRKSWLRLLALFTLFIVLVKGPLYALFEVEQPGRRRTEIMGVPLNIISSVAREHPERLDDETLAFVTGMAPLEVFQEKYSPGNFNSIKWTDVDTNFIDATPVPDMLRMTARCIMAAPFSAARGFFALTDQVYKLEGIVYYDAYPEARANEYTGNERLAKLVQGYRGMANGTILRYIFRIGSTIAVMLAFMLGRGSLRSKRGMTRLLLCAPVLVYDFGTMLLLTGADNRFFFVNILVCPIVVLMTCWDTETQTARQNT